MHHHPSKRAQAILVIATIMGAGFLWLAVHQGASLGSEANLDSGKVKARNFSLQVLAYPPELRHLISTQGGKDTLDLATLQGHHLMINFWASWCLSCKQEAKIIDQIWRDYTHQNLIVIGVVLHDDPTTALEYARMTGKEYIIAYDESAKMSIDYGLTGVPETLFISEHTYVHTKVVGPLHPEKTTTIIAAMLGL